MIKCALAAARVVASIVNNGLRGNFNGLISYLNLGGIVAENDGAIYYNIGRGLSP